MKNENMKNENMKNENMKNENMNGKEFEEQVDITREIIDDMEANITSLIEDGNENPETLAMMKQTIHDLRVAIDEFEIELNGHTTMNVEEEYDEEENTEPTCFTITTPFGPLEINLLHYEGAQLALAATRKKVKSRSFTEKLFYDFLGEESAQEGKYWRQNLGKLMKIYLDSYLSLDWECVEEFSINDDRKVACTYSTYDFASSRKERYLVEGYRFYQSRHSPGERFIMKYSADGDGDHWLYLIRAKSEIPQTEPGEDAPPNLIDKIDTEFYLNGPLKGEFFDIRYNFITRDPSIEELIAWDEEVKELLWNDVITFQKAMPVLFERGIPNSRGIILAGPPGTGKTMMAKWLAANSKITCILISAEMISGRHDIKQCYEVARKLSPSLLIIEDIDTAGALDRRASDHPLLGEFLQAMDGIVPNHGVITLATTNHSDKIDPAIADRPGRFDRIIEVGLPRKNQRFHILKQLLEKLDVDTSVDISAIDSLAKASEGLTGAWLRELVQSAFISTFVGKELAISNKSLIKSLKDVMKRRGMAYRVAGYGTDNLNSDTAYLIYD